MSKYLIFVFFLFSIGKLKSQSIHKIQYNVKTKFHIGEYFYLNDPLEISKKISHKMGYTVCTDIWIKKTQENIDINKVSIFLSKFDGCLNYEKSEEYIIDTIQNVIYQVGLYDKGLGQGNLMEKPSIFLKLPPNKWVSGTRFDGKNSYSTAAYGKVILNGKTYLNALIIKREVAHFNWWIWYYIKGHGFVKHEIHTIDNGILTKLVTMELKIE